MTSTSCQITNSDRQWASRIISLSQTCLCGRIHCAARAVTSINHQSLIINHTRHFEAVSVLHSRIYSMLQLADSSSISTPKEK